MIYPPSNLRIPATIIRDKDEPQSIFERLVLFGREHEMPSSYVGDLYHDALYLQKYIAELLTDGYFYFGLRYTGTSIGTDWTLVEPYNLHTALCILPTVEESWISAIEEKCRRLHGNRPERPGRELMSQG